MDDSKYPRSRFGFPGSSCPMMLQEREHDLLELVEHANRRCRLAVNKNASEDDLMWKRSALYSSVEHFLEHVKYLKIREEEQLMKRVKIDNPYLYEQVEQAKSTLLNARMALWQFAEEKRKERLRERRKLFMRWYAVVRFLILCIRSRERANAPGGEGHKRARRSYEAAAARL